MESAFLPLESLPRLEATINMDELFITRINMKKAVNENLDEDEDEESSEMRFIAKIKALATDTGENRGFDRKRLIAAIKARDDRESNKKKGTAAASDDDYIDELEDQLDDEDERVKSQESLFATVAIGNLGPAVKHAVPKLASLLLLDEAPNIQLAAIAALGAIGRDAKSQLCNLVGFLTVENENLRLEAGHAIARISAPLYSEQDLDVLDPLESAAAILDKDPRQAEYANSVHVSVSVLKAVEASVAANRADDYSVSELAAGSPLGNSGEVLLNGIRVKLDVSADQSYVQFSAPKPRGRFIRGSIGW